MSTITEEEDQTPLDRAATRTALMTSPMLDEALGVAFLDWVDARNKVNADDQTSQLREAAAFTYLRGVAAGSEFPHSGPARRLEVDEALHLLRDSRLQITWPEA